MTTIPHSLAAAVAVSFCLAILPAVPVIAGEDAVPASDTVSLGVAYADLGDFSGDWGLRIRWNHGHWLIAGGWTNVNDVVPAQGGAMKVDGDLW
ncbi:MAG: hypothetical protein H5T86_10260, partial [Armatimonadetes bacterium]|nr:hypothetical protein [Armatimonadota bacterium]